MGASATVLVIAAIFAAIDWWAVERGRRTVEVVAKPLTMAALVGVAAVVGSPAHDVRIALVVGALFGLVGDIALLGTGEQAFLAGLGSFALGHVAYVAAALAVGWSWPWALPGAAFLIALLGFRFVGRTLPGATRQGGRVLGVAVAVYAVVISAMVVTAWGAAAPVASVGAMSFAISDWLIGYTRFVEPLPHARLAVMTTYHVGQALLVIGLATA